MRSKLLIRNITASLFFQLVTLVCGFVLPRFTLSYFGSEVNGLVNSINQFLQAISFLELGVGAVVQSALYKPLAENNYDEVSKVITSADRFFRKIGIALIVYLMILLVVYPYITNSSFSISYIDLLLVIMCCSSFAQYFLGVVDRLFLIASQRGFVAYLVQTCCIAANAISCIILIELKQSIHVVKIATAIIYVLQPIVIRTYINKHYRINRHVIYTDEPIKQKWNGVAQHVSALILDTTDTIVLTVFSSLQNVSIYSIYNLVVNGLKTLLMSVSSSTQALMGELWAKGEMSKLKDLLSWYEWIVNVIVNFTFGCASVLIVSFVKIYTTGVTDANYEQPIFAVIITAANAMYCLRLPYNTMVLAAGHYKETQNSFIISAALNLSLSVIFVKAFGLVGVALGTLISMGYQTVWLAEYVSRNMIKGKKSALLKQLSLDIIIWILASLICRMFSKQCLTFIAWICEAAKDACIWALVIVLINFLFNREYMYRLYRKVCKKKNGNN